jgi:hypothetical protein
MHVIVHAHLGAVSSAFHMLGLNSNILWITCPEPIVVSLLSFTRVKVFNPCDSRTMTSKQVVQAVVSRIQ